MTLSLHPSLSAPLPAGELVRVSVNLLSLGLVLILSTGAALLRGP